MRFTFKPTPLSSIVLPSILAAPADYGGDPSLGLLDPAELSKGRKRVVIDFGSPNIAKPFHAGHLRSTIIGGFLANVYEQAGWEVVRLNYLGDWGKQYGVLAVGFTEFGSWDELERDPVGHLFQVYVKISAIARDELAAIKEKESQAADATTTREQNAALESEIRDLRENSIDERARKYFRRMCDGDEEALGLWRTFRELSIERYTAAFARLNIRYDVYEGESQIEQSRIDEATRVLEERGLSEESDGATIVDLSRYSRKLGKAIVRKRDGTSIYLTRDIGAVFQRYERYRYDKMIYVIASQQDLHMMQLIKIVEIMGRGDLAKRLQHVNFGLVHGMSTRRGTVKFLDDILRDAGEKMHEVMRANESKYLQVEDPEGTADILGISAVIVQDMTGKRYVISSWLSIGSTNANQSRRINGYTFDIDRMTSSEGDTGPYLQYSHARLCSIIRKAEIPSEKLIQADLSLLSEKHAVDIVRTLTQWPEVFKAVYGNQEPITVLTYLFRLTHVLNSSYDRLNVIKSEYDVKLARLALYQCVQHVLNNGMKLLGLVPLQRLVLEPVL